VTRFSVRGCLFVAQNQIQGVRGLSGRITALKLQARNSGRINVFLDDRFAFGLSARLARDLQIGQHLSEEQIKSLQVQDAVEVAYQGTLRRLARRDYSSYELRLGMRRKDIDEDVQDEVIERLHEERLVDDQAFAEAWVENRLEFRPRGARALRAELKNKGVPSQMIDAALEGLDERRAAEQAACKGARRYQHLSYEDFRRRLSAYLFRRGFETRMISSLVEELWGQAHGEP
jgi:regulatory protein